MSSSLLIRAQNLVRLSFLSDAATMPLHWIYDQNKITSILTNNPINGNHHNPIFYPILSCAYYKYQFGYLSPWGDESLPFLKSLSDYGSFNIENIAESYYHYFKTYEIETIDKPFIGRLNHVPKEFIKNREETKALKDCAINDFQSHGIIRVPILVARYLGNPNLASIVEDAVGILQSTTISKQSSVLLAKLLEHSLLHDISVKVILEENHHYHTTDDFENNLISFIRSDQAIAEYVVFNDRLIEAIPSSADDPYRKNRIIGAIFSGIFKHGSLQKSFELTTHKPEDQELLNSIFPLGSNVNSIVGDVCVDTAAAAVDVSKEYTLKVLSAFGLSCNLPGVLLGPLYIRRKYSSLIEAIEVNILAGGDNCSRAIVLGPMYVDTTTVIPHQWIEAMNKDLWSRIEELTNKLVSDNSNLA